MHGSPKKLFAKALSLYNSGQRDSAIEHLQALVAQAPKHLDGNFLLGTFLAEKGNLTEGRRYLTVARSLNPSSLQVLNNLGNLLRMQGDMEEALACYRKVISLDPLFAPGWVNLGYIHSRLENWQDVIASFKRVGGESSADPDILRTLASAYLKTGDKAKAVTLFEKALALAPDDRHGISIILAGLEDRPLPERHPDSMVLETYRTKAAEWDKDVLRPGDSYFGPTHLNGLLAPWLKDGAAFDILDLGCGTGNCGSFLAPAARRLVGVDLSPAMLQEAANKRLYTELVEDEIGRYLSGSEETFDVVVGAGIFIMFSHLEAVFASVTGKLKPGGLFAFTLYKSPEKEIEVRHNNHFGHSIGYVERVISGIGLETIKIENVIHETAVGEAQEGLAVLLRKGDR